MIMLKMYHTNTGDSGEFPALTVNGSRLLTVLFQKYFDYQWIITNCVVIRKLRSNYVNFI